MSLVGNGQRLAFIMSQPVPDDPHIKQRLTVQEQQMLSLLQACRSEGMCIKQPSNEWLTSLFDHMIHAGWEWQHKHHIPWEQAADQAWTVFERSFQ